jgi:simple sugar transport system permease protein
MMILTLVFATLRTATPLLFAALGGLLSERSGIIMIALEGFLLVGAFAGSAGAGLTGSSWAGFLFAGVAGLLFAALYGFFAIRLRSNQVVAGTAINLLAMGATPFCSQILYGSTVATPTLPGEKLLGGWVTVLAISGFFLLHFAWKRLPAFLWLRFAGEHPEALESAGIRVNRVRWSAVLAAGFLAGLGGGTLSLALSSAFTRNMSAGRGFMALAAVILGKWRPVPTFLACLLFAFSEAAQILLQGVILWGTEPVPVQWIQIFPYLLTLVVVGGLVGRSRPPTSLGV